MTQYIFDIRRGHYKALNEGQEPVQQPQEQTGQQTDAQPEKAILKNLNTEEINQMQKQKQEKLQNADKEIQKRQDVILQMKNKIADFQKQEKTDQLELNKMQKDLLQAMQDLSAKMFDKAKIEADEDKRIFSAQMKLLESMGRRAMPLKYHGLNESNVQNAKVYVNSLIDNDEQERIKGLVDFKKVFRDSELIYGKDDSGYFAVCVDQEDFNKLSNTLEEAGWLKEEILAQILPQIFDRSSMI